MRLLPEVAATPVRRQLLPCGQFIACGAQFGFRPRRRPHESSSVASVRCRSASLPSAHSTLDVAMRWSSSAFLVDFACSDRSASAKRFRCLNSSC